MSENNENQMNDIHDILSFCRTMSVLYIENDNDVRYHTREMMEGLFDSVVTVTNGEEGLREYKQYHRERLDYFDIVLTDIQMPYMDGITMSEAILELNPKQIIIINSAYSDTHNLLQLIDLGINYFLPKPMHFKQLFKILQKVSTVIHSSRLTENYSKELTLLNNTLSKTIEELKHSIQVAEDATKAKDNFFATISHEIRTPMNAIIGLCHLTLQTDLDGKQNDYLNKIKNSGDHLLGLVNDILDFSKIEAGKLTIENIEFNINATLDNISSMIGMKAQEKGLEIIYDIDKSVPAIIKGDPLRLGQILINLMNNAVKFTDQGEITLKAKMSPLPQNKKLLIFEVIDTGIGLTQEQISNLFQSFSQADSTISRKYGGTGLGLNISKQLVEMMGGGIRVVSEYGVGSRFIFSIVTEQPHLSSYRLPSKSLMSKKVLIIDSHPKPSSALSQMLGYFRYTTLVASSKNEAKTLLEENDFDIICIDKPFMEQIEEGDIQEYKKSKIVLIESGLLQNHQKEYTHHMIDTRLHKPFNQQMIFDMILDLFTQDIPESTRESKKISKQDLAPLRGSNILLAEDNTINQMVMLGLLDDTGIKITIANNGEEAYSYTKKLINIDLILMDISMPIMDGYEATRLIREDSRYDSIPIVALSASNREDDKERAKKVGMQEYLEKPINVEKLYQLLLDTIIPKAKAVQNRDKKSDTIEMIEYQAVYAPEILNRAEGLSYVDGNDEQYEKLLEKFLKISKKSALKIEVLIKASLYKKASHIIHEIKIAAEKIAAPTLYIVAQQLEEAIESNHEKIIESLLLYRTALEPLLDIIRDIKDEYRFKLEQQQIDKQYKILNEQEGLKRVNNQGDIYINTLFDFADKYRDSTETLKSYIEKRESYKSFKLIKEIKIIADDIVASSLLEASSNLENALKRKESNIDTFINELNDALEQLFAKIDSFREIDLVE